MKPKMTPEEALFLFNNMEFAEKYQGKDEYAEMTIVIKQALEKQTPKKPNLHPCGWTDVWRCSVCNGYLGEEDEFDLDKGNYCPCCGQALNWSDTE